MFCLCHDSFLRSFFVQSIKAVILFLYQSEQVSCESSIRLLLFFQIILCRCVTCFLLSKKQKFEYFKNVCFLGRDLRGANIVGRLSMWHLIKVNFFTHFKLSKLFITFAASCGIYASKDKESSKGSFPNVCQKK